MRMRDLLVDHVVLGDEHAGRDRRGRGSAPARGRPAAATAARLAAEHASARQSSSCAWRTGLVSVAAMPAVRGLGRGRAGRARSA